MKTFWRVGPRYSIPCLLEHCGTSPPGGPRHPGAYPPGHTELGDFFNNFFRSQDQEDPPSVLGFNFMYIQYRQDAGIRTRDAATAARCATNELHTSLKINIMRSRHFMPVDVLCRVDFWCVNLQQLALF